MTVLFSAIVAITNLCGTTNVDTHGARVVSYVPVGGGEVLFMSSTGTGGLSLCWPWFAGLGPCKDSARHGVARYRDFKVTSVRKHAPWDSEIMLRLESDAATRRAFPHDFALDVSVRLTDRLTVKMTGENTGNAPFAVTEAFCPHFVPDDSMQISTAGMETPECHIADAAAKRAYILKPGEKHVLAGEIRLSVTHANAKPLDVQSMIESAAASGGGVVTIPPGEWLTRSIRLKSNV